MANRHRGEIDAVLDGERYTLCLTLGALAELEDAFRAGDLAALADRFGEGRLTARDAIAIVTAGLRGGGTEIEPGDVARMRAEGGASGFARIVTELLVATFGGSTDAADTVTETASRPDGAGEGAAVERRSAASANP